MSKLDNQPYRGTRDFKPAAMRRQNHIFNTWFTICESFGYEEYMTPLLEPVELYTSKTSEEIVSEQAYSFTDRGDRTLTIRPEMTPSVARLVSQDRLENGYPLRLFSMANFMRYERPQKGRLREFWQLNADLFGDDGQRGDVEIIQLADTLMQAFGADASMYEVRVSHRQLLKDLCDATAVEDSDGLTRLVDAHDKMSTGDFQSKLSELGADETVVMEFMNAEALSGLPAALAGSETVKRLQELEEALDLDTVVIDQTIARGFDYYTGMVFEVFDKNPDNNRSLFGGGRYDALLENFGVDPLPTVGFGMGDATLAEFLDGHDLWPQLEPATEVWVVVEDDPAFAESVATELRIAGLNVAIDYSGRKAGKQIKTALTHGIPYVLFPGDGGTHGLKQLATGEQSELTIEQITDKLSE
jgi:histidyl-tRNA synthetase